MAEVRCALRAIYRKRGASKRGRQRDAGKPSPLTSQVAGDSMADLESLPIALKDVGKKPSLAGQAFGVLFVLLALGAVALVTGLLLGGVIQRPMASAVPFIYVAAAGVLALGLRFIIGGAIDVLFLGVLGGGLVGGIGGVGLGFFFTEMSKHGPTGTMVGAAVGVGAGAILR